MTDKEVKRLNKAQLIDIIYQLQLRMDELTEKNRELEAALEDKRLRMRDAGDIAHAALEMNACFQSAQTAAEQYLSEIRAMHAEMETERQRLLAEAQREADLIIATANLARNGYDPTIEEILKKYGQNRSDNG